MFAWLKDLMTFLGVERQPNTTVFREATDKYSAPTHRQQSAQENIGGQIYNQLKGVTKECITRSGSRLDVIRLGVMEGSVDYQILVGWEVWPNGKYQCTHKLMYIIVSLRDIRIELTNSEYVGVIPFLQPYFASMAPSGVIQVVIDVERYLRDYHAKMQKNYDKYLDKYL